MKLKALAMLALAAIGLGAGTSFETVASSRDDCLAECRADLESCRMELPMRYCLPAYRACTAGC